MGAILIAGGYGAWLVIPFVLGADLTPNTKTALTTVLGATPLLTKLLAIALLGRPTIDFLKRHSFKLFRNNYRPRRLAAQMSALCQDRGRHRLASRGLQ